MKNRNSSGTGLFLMELILAILLFAVSATICIQLFVSSHIISQNSTDLNHSIFWAQNIAETFYACSGSGKEMSLLFEHCSYDTDAGNETLTLLFDKDFHILAPTDESTYAYTLSAQISSDKDGLVICRILIKKTADDKIIYQLQPTLFPVKETSYD